ncbi:hypothetical protein HYV89_03935 [Candidatus Woesearchaeota archaeon]|nr:hypothetical protein [Candidatus Woesearchaeota archaeon]
MNKTQEKAFQWLLNQGYKKEDISIRQNASPAFTASDGKKFEARRLYGAQIIFYSTQYQQLKHHPKALILVFRENEEEPFAKFRFEEISSLPKSYKGIDINWVSLQQDIGTIRVSKKTKERLQAFGKMGEDFDKLINRLLDKVKKNG